MELEKGIINKRTIAAKCVITIALIRPSVEAKIGDNKVLSAKVISDMAYIGESEEAVA